jgi:hypothetical protein
VVLAATRPGIQDFRRKAMGVTTTYSRQTISADEIPPTT